MTDSTWDPWRVIPARYNLGAALTRGQVERGLGNKTALLWENSDGASRALSYWQLDALSSRLASALQTLGVGRDDRVFLRLPIIPEFYVAALAVAKAGAIFIPSSTQFRAVEVEYRLKDSGAKAAITTTNLADVIDQVRSSCPELRHVIEVPYPDAAGARRGSPDPAAVQTDHENYEQLIRAGDENFPPADTASSNVAFLAYTSGTTGDPKGVVHLHRYPIAYESLLGCWHDYRPDDLVACPSDLGWLLPIASTFLYALSRGLTVVLFDPLGGRFDPRKWFELFQKYRITSFTAPPTTYRMLMADAEAARHHDLSSWRHAVTAGEPLPADTLAAIQRHFRVAPLDGIGMSECMVYCCNQVGMTVKPGSCGRPTPGTIVELMDDDMKPVPEGAEGVLCVRRDSHPGMMREYWNKPERTAEMFRGGWYVSGDVLVRDADGYFWFKGRNDDVIKASGYRISPFEVESCLMSHPAVLEVAAVESPDALRGMVVKAYVVLRPGFTATPELAAAIQEHARQNMAPYKAPRRLEFIAALPKTTSGKIKRRELRQ